MSRKLLNRDGQREFRVISETVETKRLKYTLPDKAKAIKSLKIFLIDDLVPHRLWFDYEIKHFNGNMSS